MRRFMVFLGAGLLAACSAGVVYRAAPEAEKASGPVLQMYGTVHPAGLYFTALILPKTQQTRVIVLGDMGIKWLDFQVFPRQTEVYYKMPRLPDSFIEAFARMARQELVDVQNRQISFTDTKTGLLFEGEIKGDLP